MITLGPSDRLSAGAGSASAVNYVIEGEMVGTASGATPLFMVLASGQLGTTVSQLFTPGTGTQALVSRIAFFNTTGSAVTVTVAESGITTAAMSIPANGFSEYEPQSGWTVYSSTGLPVAGGGTGGSGVSSVNTRTGAVTLKASDVAGGSNGTANQLLATDGSGNGSWVNAPSGGGAVASVNTRTGAVVLKASDVASANATGSQGDQFTSDGTGNGLWLHPGSLNVAQYGVLPTNADNTGPLNTLVTNAVAAAVSAGTNYAELFFPPGVYNYTAATTKGSPTFGNAQIPLPVIAGTAPKFTLVFRGGFDAATLPHWQQTTGQKNGVAFRTTAIGTNDGTNGEASVIGGPTPQQGYGTGASYTGLFTNLNFCMTGISIVSATTNPTMCGVDLRGVAQMHIGTLGCFCDAATSVVTGVSPSNNWVFGLAAPQELNNDLCTIDSISVEGYYSGLVNGEHLDARRVLAIYCNTGVYTASAGGFTHQNNIYALSTEQCIYHVGFSNTVGNLNIHSLSVEDATSGPNLTTYHINDPNNSGRGFINWGSNKSPGTAGFPPLINGGLNLKIRDVTRAQAVWAAGDTSLITMPSSGTAFKNPFWRDCFVQINGGTVTAITTSAGGLSHNLGITSGLVMVPSGASITLTYSAAPTWFWTMT